MEETEEKSTEKSETEDSSTKNTAPSSSSDTTWESHVQKHGDLVELYPGKLWMVEGTLNKGKIVRNMVIYKMSSGHLWCHSVIALDEERMKTLESIGKPSVFIVPNMQHTIDAQVWQTRFPECKLMCPAVFQKQLTAKGLTVYGTCEDKLAEFGINAIHPPGIKTSGGLGLGGEMVYEVSLQDGQVAYVFCDILMNNPRSGVAGFLLGKTFECPRAIKWTCVSNKRQYKEWLLKLAKNESIKIICVAHGPAITENIPEKLQHAAELL